MNLKSYDIHPASALSNASSAQSREMALRTWIANKQSVCPYAPGPARYVHLPAELGGEMEWAAYLGSILRDFYAARVEGKRIERLILLPPHEWRTHQEALCYSTTAFWRISAGYFMQALNGRKRVSMALRRQLSGIAKCDQQGILNPIIGRVNEPAKVTPHYKSMFLSTFVPFYANKQFFRYAPAGALVLVNAKALFDKRAKHPRVMTQIDGEMLYGNLVEATRGDMNIVKAEIVQEAKAWETILFALYRLETPNWMSLPEPQVETTLATLKPNNVNETFSRMHSRLPLLWRLCRSYAASPIDVLKAAYLHAGLYVMPAYLR